MRRRWKLSWINTVIKRPSYKTKTTRRRRRGRKLQHLCLDKAYDSEQEEQELIKRGYVLHTPPKRKRGVKEEQKEIKIITQHCPNHKKYSANNGLQKERIHGTTGSENC